MAEDGEVAVLCAAHRFIQSLAPTRRAWLTPFPTISLTHCPSPLLFLTQTALQYDLHKLI